MKVKNEFLASLLTGLGMKVTAELVIDDSNGVTLTFPDISEIGEIAVDVAVDAVDGTYVIANDTKSITVVVVSGKVTEVTENAEEPPVDATVIDLNPEVKAVLTAIVAKYSSLETKYTALAADHAALKVALKHPTEAAKGAKTDTQQFTII